MADIVFETGEGITEADEDENIESSTPTERTDSGDDDSSSSSSSSGSSSSSSSSSDNSSSSGSSDNEYVLRDGEGNVIDRTDDAEDVGYNEDTSPENDSNKSRSSNSNNTTEAVNADQLNNNLDIDPIKDPSELEARTPENPATGPDRVQVEKSITVEDKNTTVPTETGGTVSRADQIQKEAEAEEERRNLQNSAEFLEERGLEKEASEFREEAEKARKEEKQFEQSINEITNKFEQNEAIEERNNRIKVSNFLNKDIRDQVGRPSNFQQDLPRPENNPLNNASEKFFNPNRQVSRNLDFSEEAVLAGQDIIQTSEDFGKRFEDNLPDEASNLVSTVGGGIAGAEQAAQGRPFEGAKTFVLPGEQNQLEKQRSEQVLQGVGAGPGTLAGFTLGGGGAVATSVEEGSTGSDLVQGAGLIAGQARENPGEFAASEIGEEIGEGIATIPFGGIGAVPTITPDVSPSVSVPDSVQTTDSFIRGDLGTRARETQLRLNTADTEFVRTNTETDPESGARLQTVEGRRFTPGGNELTTGEGFRAETPVTRTEFLADRLGIKDLDKPSDIVNTGNTLGSGVGAFVPESSTPETDTTPDNQFDPENLFDETRSPQSRLPDNVELNPSTPRTGTVVPELEQDLRNELNQGQGNRQNLGQETTPFETFNQFFDTQFTTDTETSTPDNRLETRLSPTQTQSFGQVERLFSPTETTTSSNTVSSTPEISRDQENGDNGLLDLFSREQDRNVRRSVGADIIGLEDSDLTRDEATNPLSLRGLDES